MTPHFVDSLNEQQTQQLHQLYQQAWWSAGRTLPEVQRLLSGGSLVFAALDTQDQLIAFSRVLTDGVYKAFIFDVIVAQDYQGTGLGKQLLERIISDPRVRNIKHLELYCLPELIPFYERWGFGTDIAGMQLMRRQAHPL
ncbi:MAG: GNAT family N-acetyltransferase [Steroidobacteraceae bacterium]